MCKEPGKEKCGKEEKKAVKGVAEYGGGGQERKGNEKTYVGGGKGADPSSNAGGKA